MRQLIFILTGMLLGFTLSNLMIPDQPDKVWIPVPDTTVVTERTLKV